MVKGILYDLFVSTKVAPLRRRVLAAVTGAVLGIYLFVRMVL